MELDFDSALFKLSSKAFGQRVNIAELRANIAGSRDSNAVPRANVSEPTRYQDFGWPNKVVCLIL